MRAESRQAAAQCCRHLEASGSERACRQPGAFGKRLLHPCLFRDEEQAVLRLGDRRMTTDTKLDSLGILSMRSTGDRAARRTEERRVGTGCVGTCRCRGSPAHEKKK